MERATMVLKEAPRVDRGGSREAPTGPPILWHLKVSHYNEKARWALDYKRVPHFRCAVEPGRHRATARRLTGASTFPILVLDGDAIGDSSQIIEALERRYPDPPLYPADPVARRRALEIEEFFDEELGAHMRLLVVSHMLASGNLLLGAFLPDLRGPRRRTALAMFPLIRRKFVADLAIDDESIALAWAKVRAAGECFREELQPSGYLVGDGFTVADLTLAALVAPAVAPEQFPYPQPQRGHPLLAPLREALARVGLLEWAREVYARHRGCSAETAERMESGESNASWKKNKGEVE
jgi:glutathione S-transferase